MRIRFNTDCAAGKFAFKAGQVADLPSDSAQHWMRRGLAEKCQPTVREAPAAPPQPETPASVEPAAAEVPVDDPVPDARNSRRNASRRRG